MFIYLCIFLYKYSSDRCADPSGNHISIQARKPPSANSAHHDYSLGHTSRIPSLQNGQWMKAKIRLLESGTIEIGLAEANDKCYIQVLKVENQSFKTYLNNSPKAWIGFTASTGGLSENHDVQLISIVEYRTS
jgi:peptide-N4-(N-acetyl-beta-glucosaminyl)asparagine amidase